jgi:hypothetical protein
MALSNELKEVVVKKWYQRGLYGDNSKGQKTYNSAERKLYATDLNVSANVGSMMGGSVSPIHFWIDLDEQNA